MSITLIQTVTVGVGGASSIDFNNISNAFTDLYITVSVRCDQSLGDFYAQVNGDAGSNYFWRRVVGSGTGTTTDSTTQTGFYFGSINGTGQTSSVFSSLAITIPNYTLTGNKITSAETTSENNASNAYQTISTGRWTGTAAVTSVRLISIPGNLVQGSTASIYGINRTQAIGKPKAIGGVISYANNRWFHTFTSSGTFSTKEAIDIDALVVAGGGGGGAYDAGGGGAGGYQTLSTSLNTIGNYSVTVGAGGPGGIYYSPGRNGAPSNFLTTTSIGGGGGGSAMTYQGAGEAGNPGASGGGARGGRGGGNTGGFGTAGQGNNGGSSSGSSGYGAGGGGGAGAGGGVGTTSANGSGGAGLQWLDGNYYAGGGGGSVSTGYGIGTPGSGGIGGGGAAGTPPVAGTANTGGGGGGNRDSTPGATGGSGVVVISYPAN